mmetsp:Transcript_2833/g.8483  ORF Transcript_2833/g.8483 Transcript_2833/m.8483 type:complete len:375 (+) Transcript_2833:66-1190(+)
MWLLAIAVAAVARGAAMATEVPSTMSGYVQLSEMKQELRSGLRTPGVGDLRKEYGGLPASCEVLVRVEYSSVNPSDRFPTVASSTLPHVLGSDMFGTVVAAESNCPRLKVGDRVWGDIGANTKTRIGGTKTKELGGYGQYAVALETQLGVVPASMTGAVAGSLPKVALTSYKALVWYAGAKNDSLWKRSPKVLVLGGSGGTGTTGIQLAKAFGAGEVITTTSADNFDYCKGLGADTLIDYKTQDWWDISVIADDSVDVVYDCVGQDGTGNRAMSKIKPGGYYVTITGQLATHVKQGVKQAMFINSDTNLDNFGLLDDLASVATAGHLRMPHLTHFPLDEVAAAFGESATGTVLGKLVIDVDGSAAEGIAKPTQS